MWEVCCKVYKGIKYIQLCLHKNQVNDIIAERRSAFLSTTAAQLVQHSCCYTKEDCHELYGLVLDVENKRQVTYLWQLSIGNSFVVDYLISYLLAGS